jgi:hypothetical protein
VSVYDLSRTSCAQDMRWVGACRSPIQPLSVDWHSDSISSCTLDGNQFIIYSKIPVSGGPNIQVSQIVVTAALEVL